MPEDSSGRWKKVVIIVVVILTILIFLITFLVGIKGLGSFFMWLLGAILVVSIIGLVVYLVWLIFIAKTYKDIPATYRKKLTATAKLMKNKMLGDLWLSGDYKHNRVKLGKFAYLRITLPKAVKEVKLDEDGKPIQGAENKVVQEEFTKPVPVDCFVVIKKGIMDRLFGQPLFILVKPQDHNHSSIFADVTLNGFNLVPLDSQFFTLNHRNLDIDITRGMATNYIREVVYEIFRDLDKLVKQAMNLDQEHQKMKEKMYEFPAQQGQIEQ